MPEWRIYWKLTGSSKVKADRLSQAIDELETGIVNLGDGDDLEITHSELISGEPEKKAAEISFLGIKFPIIFSDEEDEPEMPLLFPIKGSPKWWSNGHVALRLDEDPPVELIEPMGRPNASMDRIEAQLGDECLGPEPQVAERYKRFLGLPGTTPLHFAYKESGGGRPRWITAIKICLEETGELVGIVMCERPAWAAIIR